MKYLAIFAVSIPSFLFAQEPAAQEENTSVEVGRELRGIWIDNGFFIDNPLNLSLNADIGPKYGISLGVGYVERIKGEDTFFKTADEYKYMTFFNLLGAYSFRSPKSILRITVGPTFMTMDLSEKVGTETVPSFFGSIVVGKYEDSTERGFGIHSGVKYLWAFSKYFGVGSEVFLNITSVNPIVGITLVLAAGKIR